MTVEKGDDEMIPDAEMNLRKVQSFLIFEPEHLSTRPEWHCVTDLVLIHPRLSTGAKTSNSHSHGRRLSPLQNIRFLPKMAIDMFDLGVSSPQRRNEDGEVILRLET